jgi:thioesterase domain-containing protein
MELHLKQIWARMLGHSAFGVNDSFFDSGGHSLLAVRLINQINRSFEIDLPVPAFVRNPTLAGLAEILQHEEDLSGRPKLLSLLESDRNMGDLFFIAPGLAECRMTQFVNTELNIFATWVPLTPITLKAASLRMTDDLPLLEEMAAPHVELIKNRVSSGPCLLAGYSFNGLLAYEVAHQLRRKGKLVDLVLLLDSRAIMPWWRRITTLSLSEQLQFTRRYSSQLMRKRRNMPDSEPGSRLPVTDSQIFADRQRPEGSGNRDVPWEVERTIYHNAQKKYRLRPLASRGLLFRSQDNVKRYRTGDATLGWGGLFTRGLGIVDLQGDHLSFVTESHARLVAQRFSEACRIPATATIQHDVA